MYEINICSPIYDSMQDGSVSLRATRILFAIDLLLLCAMYHCAAFFLKRSINDLKLEDKEELEPKIEVMERDFKKWEQQYLLSFGDHIVAVGFAMIFSPYQFELVLALAFLVCKAVSEIKQHKLNSTSKDFKTVFRVLNMALLVCAMVGLSRTSYDNASYTCDDPSFQIQRNQIQKSLASSQNYTSFMSRSSRCIHSRSRSSCYCSLAAAYAFAFRSSSTFRRASSCCLFSCLAEWTQRISCRNSRFSAARCWCFLLLEKRSSRASRYFFLFSSFSLVLASFLMKRMQTTSMNSYSISSQLSTLRILGGSLELTNNSPLSRASTSLSKYFSRIFSSSAHSASAMQPFKSPSPSSRLIRTVSSLCVLLWGFCSRRALKTSVLALRQKGVRFFSALLMEDLFSERFSLPASLMVLLMLSRKGAILAISFSIDFCGRSKLGSRWCAIQTSRCTNYRKRIFAQRSCTRYSLNGNYCATCLASARLERSDCRAASQQRQRQKMSSQQTRSSAAAGTILRRAWMSGLA